MSTFYISRKLQACIIVEGCVGQDTVSREHRVHIAKAIKELLPNITLEPADCFSYDLSLLLEQLNDEDHARIFKIYLDLY